MRACLLVLVPLFAACTEAGVTKFNANPTVSITSHNEGDTVTEGVPEAISGQVGDPDNEPAELSVTWTVDDEEVCADSEPDEEGAVSCEAIFAEGGGSLVLSVTDPAGAAASQSIELEVQPTDAPQVNITAPVAGERYYADETITFQGTVSDTEDEPDALLVSIEIDDVDGVALDIDVTTEGQVEAFGTLPEGEHAVRLKAIDTSGKEGSDSVVINVGPANSPPECAITAPEEGGAAPEGEEVRFEGTVSDEDVPASELTVNWESDIDGPLREATPDSDGTVGFATSDLSNDTHRITLTATDERGATCVTSIYFTVGTPPVLIVTSPSEGDIVNANDNITFTAAVSDDEDLPNEVALQWAMDGTVFSDESADSSGAVSFGWAASEWESGEHTLEVTATDTDGLYVTELVNFTINAPPNAPVVAITPEPATTTDALFALATGSEDPDESGTVSYRYVWFENGIEIGALTGAEYPAAATRKGNLYRVDVYASDGTHESEPGSAERTVINTAPDITDAGITPAEGRAGSTLECTATTTDVDGDAVAVVYTWSDGTTGPSFTIPADAEAGDTITCTISATDDDGATDTEIISLDVAPPEVEEEPVDTGEPEPADDTAVDEDTGEPEPSPVDDPVVEEDTAPAEDTASLENTPPVIDTIVVEPDAPTIGDTITCSATATDADGDELTFLYTWSDDSVGPHYTVSDTHSVGDEIVCTVVVTDPHEAEDALSATATVANSTPKIETVTLSPALVYTNDTVTATVDASDADDDVLTTTYQFWVDGILAQEGPLNTLDGTIHFDKHQTIVAKVFVTDGSETTEWVDSDEVVVQNSPPTAPTVSIKTDDCPMGWTGMADGVRCVAVFDDPVPTWAESEALCNDWGGNLARIENMDDNDLVFDLAADIPDEVIWIGYTDADSEGTWEWSDGGPKEFENWRSGEPDSGDSVSDEDCAALVHNHSTEAYNRYWVDEHCETAGWVGGYACQLSTVDDSYSLYFPASRDAYLQVSDHDLPIGDEPRSFSVWFKSNASWTNGNIFSYGIGERTIIGNRFSLFINMAGYTPGLHIAGESYDHFIGEISYTTDEWQHAVVSYDGDTLNLYVQGILRGSKSGMVFNTAPGTDFNIGMNTTDRMDEYYHGSIAEIRAWDRALDEYEVSLELKGLSVEDGLIAYWDFSEGAGSTTHEALGTGWDASFMTVGSEYAQWDMDLPGVIADRMESDSACGEGWNLSESGDRCFRAFPEPTNWDTAQANCETHGGNLITLTSLAEVEEAMDIYMASGPDLQYFLMGYTDREAEDDFKWVSGNPSTFTHWAPGEPNDMGGVQDCAMVTEDAAMYWDDISCTAVDTFGSMCEKPTVFGNGLTCTIEEESTDDDGDTITYTFEWDVDGVAFTDTDTRTRAGDTVPYDALGPDELWTCTVTPNDGDEDGEAGTANHLTPCSAGESIDCPALDCNDVLTENPAADSGVYWIQPVAETYEVYCNMDTDGGGWTLVMKAVNGNFLYMDSVWTTEDLFDETDLDITAGGEAKYQSFNEVPFTELLTTDPDDFLVNHSEYLADGRDSALDLFSEPTSTLLDGGTFEDYYNNRAPSENQAWGCTDYDRYGFNLYEALGCTYISHSMNCDHNGGARWGNRVNGYFSGTGNIIGQGWASYGCSRSDRPWEDTGTGVDYIYPIRELMWVR